MNLYATWPFASLVVTSRVLEMEVMGRRFVFHNADDVQLARRRGVFSPGLEITNPRGDVFLFWTFDMEHLVARLESFGYVVD